MAEAVFTPNATAAEVKIDDIFGWVVQKPGGRGMRNLDRVATYVNGRVLSFKDKNRDGVAVRIFKIADFNGRQSYVTHRLNAKVQIQNVPAKVREICFK
jgi:hypothetical protein